MSEMIERVAKAIREMEWDNDTSPSPPNAHDDAEAIARRAIEAMREPSDGMIEALWPGEPDYFAGKVVPLRRMTVEGWRAMIDAALEQSA